MTGTLRTAAFLDKGGTGKPTTVAHLGVALAQLGQDVLALDLAGKRGVLGEHLGVYDEYAEQIAADEAWPTIAEKLGDRAVADLILETAEGVDLIPAHPGPDSLDAGLGNVDAHERYTRLEGFFDEYVDPLGYDVVLIDLPGLANNVAYNGLWAATNVLAPVEMEPFKAEQASALREDLEKIADTFDVEVSLVPPNKVDTRTTLADEYLAALREQTDHGDRLKEAATDDSREGFRDTIAEELRGAVRDHATQNL